MTTLDTLKPLKKPTVMELVQNAGIDVSDWSNFKGKKRRAASNPKYCYEWCFTDNNNTIVLNIWHHNMRMQNEDIIALINYHHPVTAYSRNTNSILNARRKRFDAALQKAYDSSIPVRIIINDGKRRSSKTPNAKPSTVKKRYLDPIPWSVQQYGSSSGDCVLMRYNTVGRVGTYENNHGNVLNDEQEQEEILQHFKEKERSSLVKDLKNTKAKDPKIITINNKHYSRDNKTIVILKLLRDSQCQICNKFILKKGGSRYVEAAHIVPKRMKGNELPENILILCPNHHKEFDYGNTIINEHNKKHIDFTMNGVNHNITLSVD